MGKPEEQSPAQPSHFQDSQPANCLPTLAKVLNVISLRCVLVLILGACVCLSAIFWLPPFRSWGSNGAHGDLRKIYPPIEAMFELKKPVSLLAKYTHNLESDIMDEIGVPNTKVAIISFNSTAISSWTKIVFGVLPYPSNAPIPSWSMSLVRASMVELVTRQTNLSLNQSLFGKAASFGMLKFPGGITVVPMQYASIWQKTQILFNFTLNNSISQIQENLYQLKGQLEYGLQLRPYESMYVELTNSEGSTLHPPVIVQASVFSSTRNSPLLPQRLKQLARALSGSRSRNLGLDHAVFGNVKQVRLSSYLQHSLSSVSSPAPSPSPKSLTSMSPSPSPSVSSSISCSSHSSSPDLPCSSTIPSLAPVANPHIFPPFCVCAHGTPFSAPGTSFDPFLGAPCASYCDTISPSRKPPAYAPEHSPSNTVPSPTHTSYHGQGASPDPSPQVCCKSPAPLSYPKPVLSPHSYPDHSKLDHHIPSSFAMASIPTKNPDHGSTEASTYPTSSLPISSVAGNYAFEAAMVGLLVATGALLLMCRSPPL